ncbi:MAG TPA: DUF5996 family protein [Acidobacteriota bacterium]|nr:DUF5996 family protein [Acidobacteriota bacterium]
MRNLVSADTSALPELPLDAWQDTYDTLHMWTQVVGKIPLMLHPHMNHWWEVALQVGARGLTTRLIPHKSGVFQIRFDFISHELVIETDADRTERIPLRPRTVADFYKEFMGSLAKLGIEVKMYARPVEVPEPIRFEEDFRHASYDSEAVSRFWRILVFADTVFKEFRSGFIGKCSPVHFFWGSFDLAVTRFSGRRAPERAGVDPVTREAYSHEVISAGFWPGSGEIKGPAFYAYSVPEPSGFAGAAIRPSAAFYHSGMQEFFLMYDDVRSTPFPGQTLLEFLESTYDAGANLAGWNRSELEREPIKRA